jgi:Ni/Fe-hydrogenase subunit HybB-like protein
MRSSSPGSDQRWVTVIWALMVVAGVIGFLVGISGPDAQRAWQAYLVNFVFWFGLAAGAAVFVATLNMTNARWARPIKRVAEAPAAFLPFSFLLFWVLYLGREEIFPWIREPVAGKEGWLSASFLFARNGAGLFLFTASSLALLYYSLRGDVASASGQTNRAPGMTHDDSPGGKQGRNEGSARDWRRQIVLSPVVGILYAIVLSLLAFDLIMSLDPHWYSTLFGAYYFVGSFYTSLAGLILLLCILRKRLGLSQVIKPKHFHDLGKLLLGFCLITGDFFYSQFLVIWYGNLPEEAKYVILRIRAAPWEPLAWTVLIVCFAGPFVVLLSRKIKLKPFAMLALSTVILVGMWLERFLLIAPSLNKGNGTTLGVTELLVTVGFLGAMAWTVTVFLRRFPILPLSDPLFLEAVERGEAEARRGETAS